MKDHTSRFLKTIAYLYLAFPVTYLAYVTVLFSISPERSWKILFSFSYWMLSLTGIAVGYGFKEMTRWAWNFFLLNALFIAYANALIAAKYSESPNPFFAFFLSVAFLVGLMFRLGKEIRVPYFLPRIRWWETNPRYKLSVPVHIRREADGFDGEILDLSMGGCFIKTRIDMNQNEHILSRFTLFGEKLEIGGTVVWRSQSSVTHPKGVGIKFDPLDKTQRRIMRAATRHLKKISSVQNARGKMSPEAFNTEIAKLKAHRLGISKPSEEMTPEQVL